MVCPVKADQRVLRHLIASYIPEVDTALKQHDIGQLISGFYSLIIHTFGICACSVCTRGSHQIITDICF